MKFACTSRDVLETAQKLARQRVNRAMHLARLYELQAIKADKQFDEAELDVGRIDLAIRRNGYHDYPSPSIALKRYGHPGTLVWSILNATLN